MAAITGIVIHRTGAHIFTGLSLISECGWGLKWIEILPNPAQFLPGLAGGGDWRVTRVTRRGLHSEARLLQSSSSSSHLSSPSHQSPSSSASPSPPSRHTLIAHPLITSRRRHRLDPVRSNPVRVSIRHLILSSGCTRSD
jgi:hypothetical protein